MTTLANTAAEACWASGSINNRRQISKVSASRSHRRCHRGCAGVGGLLTGLICFYLHVRASLRGDGPQGERREGVQLAIRSNEGGGGGGVVSERASGRQRGQPTPAPSGCRIYLASLSLRRRCRFFTRSGSHAPPASCGLGSCLHQTCPCDRPHPATTPTFRPHLPLSPSPSRPSRPLAPSPIRCGHSSADRSPRRPMTAPSLHPARPPLVSSSESPHARARAPASPTSTSSAASFTFPPSARRLSPPPSLPASLLPPSLRSGRDASWRGSRAEYKCDKKLSEVG